MTPITLQSDGRHPSSPTPRLWYRSRLFWLLAVVALLGVLTRLPFRSQVLNHWDSVNFALALEHFDVRLHQPHPPGTFVIYIFLGRALDLIFQDPNTSLVWLSVILSGLGLAALSGLTYAMFGERVAWVVAFLGLSSPLVWFHGEVALSYMLEFFWVPPLVYACYQMRTRAWTPLLVSSLLLGMAGGVRPNTPVFLFPLWAAAVLINRYPVKKIIVAMLMGGVGALTWAIPMIAMSGGVSEYIEIMQWWQAQHTEESASLAGVAENVIRFGTYLFYTLGIGLLPLAAAAFLGFKTLWPALRRDWRAQTLFLWLAPGTVYLTVIHLRQPGHTFTVQPAFLLVTGLALDFLLRRAPFARTLSMPHSPNPPSAKSLNPLWLALTAGVVLLNALFFLAAPAYLFGDTRLLFNTPSWNAIQDYDQYIDARVQAVRQNFDPAHTAIVANGRNYRHIDFYLADYLFTDLSRQVALVSVDLDAPVDTLVIFDSDLYLGEDNSSGAAAAAQPGFASIPLPGGQALRVIRWQPGQILRLSQDRLEIISP